MPNMTLRTPMVWSEACLLHEPKGEVWVGVTIEGTEVPERARVIRSAMEAAGAPVEESREHGDDVLDAVHDRGLIDWLRGSVEEWERDGFPTNPGQDRVVPYVFPTAGMLSGMPLRRPVAVHGRAGMFAYDTMTLIGPGTWEAARGAVDAALTAVDLVTSGGHDVVYALCRPPGHHVTASGYGGSCYLNNAAVAAEALRRSGHERVAVVDVDAHHGNGTQMIFYDRPDVFYGSVHVDPAAGWFPHYVGHADETGRGDGVGANRNVPMAEGTPDDVWLDGVSSLVDAVRAHGATALVVSLGVDAAIDDPESPLQITEMGYRQAAAQLATLGLPTVAVQEGGYHLPSLGNLVVATVTGLESRG
ncbi:MAG TPA: histone deacetylase family protein [Actinomycetes bacterium]|nr:histone deacetylase family protein [Actinomycetes bacterium]